MKRIYQFLMCCLIFSITACQEDPISMDEFKQYQCIYIKQAETLPNALAVYITEDDQILPVNACYGGYVENNMDIQVKFQVKPELVSEFNSRYMTNYPSLDPQAYQLMENEAIIKSGELNSNILKIKLNTKGFMNPGEEYMLPVSIISIDKNIPVNEKLRTVYYILKGAYPLGEEPPTQVFTIGGTPSNTLFTYGNFLLQIAPDNRIYWYPYNPVAGLFNPAAGSDGDWGLLFNIVLPWKDGYIARWSDGHLNKYGVDPNTGAFLSGGSIGGDLSAYGLLTTSIYHNSFIGRNASGELFYIPYSADSGWGTATSFGTGWNDYTQIIGYGTGLLAIDFAGDLWYFPINDDKTLGEQQKVGSGWDVYTRIVSFGTRLLALDSAGVLWQYNFDLKGFWVVK